jgi:hypothetical protein
MQICSFPRYCDRHTITLDQANVLSPLHGARWTDINKFIKCGPISACGIPGTIKFWRWVACPNSGVLTRAQLSLTQMRGGGPTPVSCGCQPVVRHTGRLLNISSSPNVHRLRQVRRSSPHTPLDGSFEYPDPRRLPQSINSGNPPPN